jgi:hypothetical protein
LNSLNEAVDKADVGLNKALRAALEWPRDLKSYTNYLEEF